MPLFGHKTHLRVFIDPNLLQYDEVWAAAGTWIGVFGIEPHKLVEVSGGAVTDLKRGRFPVHAIWKTLAMTVDQFVHRALAIEANNSTWEILGKPADQISLEDGEEMTRRAYAAAYHWQRAEGSTPSNSARADWLLSRVWAVRGEGAQAMLHARRCMAVCEASALVDFDLAYAHEALSRAHACLGQASEARHHKERAAQVPIADPEDKAIVDGDLASEPWFGLI